MVFTTNGEDAAVLYLCISSETFTGGVGNDDAIWVSVELAALVINLNSRSKE